MGVGRSNFTFQISFNSLYPVCFGFNSRGLIVKELISILTMSNDLCKTKREPEGPLF